MFAAKVSKVQSRTTWNPASSLATRSSILARHRSDDASFDSSKIALSPPDRSTQPHVRSWRSGPLPPGGIQPKLVVGAADDPLEYEADRIADQVMRFPAPMLTITRRSPQLSRRCACSPREQKEPQTLQTERTGSLCSGNERDVPGIVHEVLRSPGQPLDALVRNDMERRFGHDFSMVRVHTDMAANASAEAANAHAYTVGHDIVFGAGKFAPTTAEGAKLIAHELAHVVQQGRASAVTRENATITPSWESRRLTGRPLICRPPARRNSHRIFRSSLSLQRQLCNRADDKIVTDPLATKLPGITCAPIPKTLKEVRDAAAKPTAMGLTETKTTTDQFTFPFKELKGSRCNAHVDRFAEPKITQSIFTKEGTYEDGTEKTPPGRACAEGQIIAKRMRITAEAAKKLSQGETEHCEDYKLAFGLSWGKYNQATKDLEGDYCAAGLTGDTICDKEFAKRFKDRTGIEFAKRQEVADCLLSKTDLRDSSGWHSAVATDLFYTKDCSAVTYIYTPASLPEVGKHPSADIVKGCGEK